MSEFRKSEVDDVLEIIENISELQKYIVLLLDANNNTPIKGNSWFQKELFLISRNVRDVEEEASFDSDMYGPWSENANEQLEDLELDDVVSKSKNKIWLSRLGKVLANELKKTIPVDEQKMVSEFKELLNNLSIDELLTLIYFTYPKFTDESLVKDKIQKNRQHNAIKLYKKRVVSLEKASEIAGVPLESFVSVVP